MRILALDLSIAATGICTPDGELSTFKPKEEGDWRLDEIAAHIRNLAVRPDGENAVHLVVMEDVLFGIGKGAAYSVGPLAMLHGAVRLQLMRKHIPYVTVSPATLKKYATGKGNSTKPDMRMAWFQRTGEDNRDDNQVDAGWLFLMACDQYDLARRIGMPQANRDSLFKVHWPEMNQHRLKQAIDAERADDPLPDKVMGGNPTPYPDKQ